MKLMCPACRIRNLFLPSLLVALILTTGISAQSRRSSASKKPVAKKTTAAAKDARKDSRKQKAAVNAKTSRRSARDKVTARTKDTKKNSRASRAADVRKKGRLTARERREAESAKKDTKKGKAESRKTAAARRRAEEERRRAILAERRRREEAARQARLRQLAFENGLKNETQENISRDNTEGEDMAVRAAAVNALGKKAGTVVVMEAQTGKIVTMVNQDWAIRNSFKPCSTIKLVTGVAGLTENVINDEGGIGQSTSGMTLDTAIARSNNGYFQRVGANIGSSKMVEYARQLGLGEPTGLNVEGETGGRVPNGNNSPRIYSHGDDFEVTPLQLAVMTSAISNGGRRVVPQVTRSRFENSNYRPRFQRPVSVPADDLEEMLPGMIGTAEYGTARRGVDHSLGIAGKTGSCIYKGTWIGLFTSVAPIENPKYSVVVITRGSGERGKAAAAIAGRIYQTLATRVRSSRDLQLAATRFGRRPPESAATAAADEDEEDDDVANAADTAGADDGNGSGSGIRYVPAPAPKPVQKPLVTKIVQSKPKFPPVIITYNKDEAEKPATEAKRPRIVKNK